MNAVAEHYKAPLSIDEFPASGYSREFSPNQPFRVAFPQTGQPTSSVRNLLIDEIPSVTLSAPTTAEVNANIMPLYIESADLGREQRLRQFIGNLRDKADVSSETASRVWRTWREISVASGRVLRVPDASAGPDDRFIFVWNKGEHHLELEFLPDGTMEFFYKNRASGYLWGEDYKTGETLTQEVLNKLAVFS